MINMYSKESNPPAFVEKYLDPVEEVISDEELDLAKTLRELCTPVGEERLDSLAETSKVLYKMGILYLSKAANSDGMLQKLSFVRCCALLKAAKYRFATVHNSEGVTAAGNALKELSASLLEASNCRRVDENLEEFSLKLLDDVVQLRKKVKEKLDSLPVIPEDFGLEDEEEETRKTVRAQMHKIAVISELNLNTTENFKRIMRDIAEKCSDLLGDAPCDFALVGLGSLARSEITMYSDFEHVIILDEGVQRLPHYGKIQEYFRWFAVVFQVIIIGFGETFVRSVGVKSINDLYSEDKNKNWFIDNFTPCGIAFDGMVPHSCNNPLGRQLATKSKPHVVELIQTPHKMAEYLTMDEHIKNGYYLQDLLTRTCLVYGSERAYGIFLERASAIQKSVDNETMATHLLESIANNVNSIIRGDEILGSSVYHDAKAELYRPITAILSYLGRLYKVSEMSSFGIIENLFSPGYDDTEQPHRSHASSHQIKFGFATACEIRLKSYTASGGQRGRFPVCEMVEFVGKESLIFCHQTVLNLVAVMIWAAKDYRSVKPSYEQRYKIDSETFEIVSKVQLGFFHDAIEQINYELNGHSTPKTDQDHLLSGELPDRLAVKAKLLLYRGMCYLALGQRNEEADINLLEAEKSFKEGFEFASTHDLYYTHHFRSMLATLYEVQSRYSDSLRLSKQYFEKLRETKDNDLEEDFRPLTSYMTNLVEKIRAKCHGTLSLTDFPRIDPALQDLSGKYWSMCANCERLFKTGSNEEGEERMQSIISGIEAQPGLIKEGTDILMQLSKIATKNSLFGQCVRIFTALGDRSSKPQHSLEEHKSFVFSKNVYKAIDDDNYDLCQTQLDNCDDTLPPDLRAGLYCALADGVPAVPEEKAKSLFKALAICKTLPKGEKTDTLYAEILGVLMNPETAQGHGTVLKSYTEASIAVQRHKELREPICCFLLNAVKGIPQAQHSVTDYERECSHMRENFDVFSLGFLNPLVIATYSNFLMPVFNEQMDHAMQRALLRVCTNFLHHHMVFGETSLLSGHYNRAVHMFGSDDAQCASDLWRVIVLGNSSDILVKKSILLMFFLCTWRTSVIELEQELEVSDLLCQLLGDSNAWEMRDVEE